MSILSLFLLAEAKPLFYLGDRFEGRSQVNISAVGALAAAIALVALFSWIWSRRHATPQRRFINDPYKLLAELAQVHGLSRSERTLLVRIARHFALPQPATLFVDPTILDQAADQAGDRPIRRAIDKLRKKLFTSLDAGAKSTQITA